MAFFIETWLIVILPPEFAIFLLSLGHYYSAQIFELIARCSLHLAQIRLIMNKQCGQSQGIHQSHEKYADAPNHPPSPPLLPDICKYVYLKDEHVVLGWTDKHPWSVCSQMFELGEFSFLSILAFFNSHLRSLTTI